MHRVSKNVKTIGTNAKREVEANFCSTGQVNGPKRFCSDEADSLWSVNLIGGLENRLLNFLFLQTEFQLLSKTSNPNPVYYNYMFRFNKPKAKCPSSSFRSRLMRTSLQRCQKSLLLHATIRYNYGIPLLGTTIKML